MISYFAGDSASIFYSMWQEHLPCKIPHIRLCSRPTQQTWDVGPTLAYCWPTVYDVGPTVNQRWANVLCLLGSVWHLKPVTLDPLTLTTLKYFLFKPKGSLQFEIINVIFSSFRFILIPMLWVYGQYKYCSFSARGSTLAARIWRL